MFGAHERSHWESPCHALPMSRTGSFLCVVALAACGGSSTPATKPVLTNTTGPAQPEQARNDVVKEAIAALAAGDVDRLMTLADPKGMFDTAFSCKDGGSGDMDARSLETGLRTDLTRAAEKMKGARIEVVSIRNEMRNWGRRKSERNATFVAKGGALSNACVAKTDVMFHEVEVRVRVSKDGSSSENKAKLDLVHARGRWFVAKMPKDLSSGGDRASEAVAKMEGFQKQMCDCKDKACADFVNEEMTKWGTEMARTAGAGDYDERPDPDLARKSADIMTKYTECMTKLMMAGAGNNP